MLCNNISAVHRVNSLIAPGIKTHTSSDFDIIQEIKVVQKGLHNTKASWVKAHQDDNKSEAALLLDAKLNIIADGD
eukprot:8908691-Ditylum_brightwellii.AAC.1